MKTPEHLDDDEDSRDEQRHTKAEFDTHANDLEHLDVGELIDDAVEFFGESGATKS